MGSLQRRLLGTLGLLAAYGTLMMVPLPGIDSAAAVAAGPVMGLLALGVAPATTAFIMVEFAALLIPRWRALRVSPSGRKRLDQAVVIVLMALAAMQTFGVVLSLEQLDQSSMGRVLDGSTTVIGLTLLAGAALAFFIARSVTNLGLLNGYLVLGIVHEQQSSHWYRAVTTHSRFGERPLDLVVALGVPIAATLACFGVLGKAKPSETELDAPVPASSMRPVVLAGSLLSMPAALAYFMPKAMRPLLATAEEYARNPFVRTALVLAFGALLCWVFARPRLLRSVFSRVIAEPAATRAAERAFRRSLVPSLLFVVALTASQLLLTELVEIWMVVQYLPLLTVIVLDGVSAWRLHRTGSWARAWRDPRPHIAAAAHILLRRADIESRALSQRQSTLLRVFAPYVLTEIWVPEADAARASELLEAAFSANGEPGEPLEADEPEPDPERLARDQWRTRTLALLVIVGCVVVATQR